MATRESPIGTVASILGELCRDSLILLAVWQFHCVHTNRCYECYKSLLSLLIYLCWHLSITLNPISLLYCVDELLMDVFLKSECLRSTTRCPPFVGRTSFASWRKLLFFPAHDSFANHIAVLIAKSGIFVAPLSLTRLIGDPLAPHNVSSCG